MVYTETLESPRLFRRKSLELDPRQGGHSIGREGTKLQQDSDRDYGAGDINMILAVLEDILGGLRFRDD